MFKAKLAFSTLVCLTLVAACAPRTQSTSPSSTNDVQIELIFEHLGNDVDQSGKFESALTLVNTGESSLAANGWQIFFNFGRMVAAGGSPEGLEIRHINGDLFELAPTSQFGGLEPGESLRFTFGGNHWLVKECEAPAGVYLVVGESPPLELAVEVRPFAEDRQTRRSQADQIPVPTASSRFHDNANLELLPPEALAPILPMPISWKTGEDSVRIDASWEIRYEESVESEARHLATSLEEVLGAELTLVVSAESDSRAMLLRADLGKDSEAYRLVVAPEKGVTIRGSDRAGVFYGVQSLLALIPPTESEVSAVELELRSIEVDDAPRFAYRGMHLDVARNFQSADSVSRLLDLMAIYKLNRFHFHLTDDEGWRLPVEGLPELTSVGARRGHTVDESDQLVPSFGSGPDPENSHGSGSYSREEFVEILRHATDRHIEVIPEIDVPGHARAAIKSMEARYQQLSASGLQEEAEEFLLTDFDDRSQYRSVQMWDDNVINVCMPSTYRFLEKVVDELVAMYAEAEAPLNTIHIGGDEVPGGVWEESPACDQLRENAQLGPGGLAGYFLDEMAAILEERGLVTAGWEEIALEPGEHGEVREVSEQYVERGFRPYVWNNVWGWGAEDLGYRLANAGYDIVLSGATHLYFDLAYDKDPLEPGYYWAGMVDTRKPWELMPMNIFANARENLMGEPLEPSAYENSQGLTDQGRANVLGIQGQLWAENALGRERMEYLAFPKLLGLAERAWSPTPSWAEIEDTDDRRVAQAEAWNEFANRLGQRELARLDHLLGGVGYRLPLPGAIVENGLLEANTAFPGLAIRYSPEGEPLDASSSLFSAPVAITGPVELRSFDTRGRSSRGVKIEPNP